MSWDNVARSGPNLAGSDGWAESGATSDDGGEPAPELVEAPLDLVGGRYELTEVLGEGQNGRVCLAIDRELGRMVAVKILRPGRASAARIRFLREAKVTAGLDHPGIVTVHDSGTLSDGRPYYVMRLVDGESLKETIRGSKDRNERMGHLRSFLAACQAVAHAHDAGVIHRDLKPANIMLGPRGETQVVDWGLARRTDDASADDETVEDVHANGNESSGATVVGAIVGTPQYMSPEQAAGASVDCRCDVWSLGVTLYELLEGRPPSLGKNVRSVVSRLRGQRPIEIEFSEPTPPELVSVVSRALARDPAQRYQTAGELALDVARYVDGERVDAYAYSPWELLTRTVRALRTPLLLALGVLLTVAAVAWWGFRGTQRERDRAVAAQRAARQASIETEAALAQALAEQARIASATGAEAEAQVLAAEALSHGENPLARGVLAHLWGSEPVVESRSPLPIDCDGLVVEPHGELAACWAGTSLRVLDIDSGKTQWETTLAEGVERAIPLGSKAERVFVVLATDAAYVVGPDGVRVGENRGGTGRVDYLRGDDRWHWFLVSNAALLRFDAERDELIARDLCEVQILAFAPRKDGTGDAMCLGEGFFDSSGQLVDELYEVSQAARAGVWIEGVLWIAGHHGEVFRYDPELGADGLEGPLPYGLHRITGAWLAGQHTLVLRDGDYALTLIDVREPHRPRRLPAVWGEQVSQRTDGSFRSVGEEIVDWRGSGAVARFFRAGHGISSIQLSPRGTWVATPTGSGETLFWDRDTGRRSGSVLNGPAVAKWTAFSHDERSVLVSTMGQPLLRAQTGSWDVTPTTEPGARRIAWISDTTLASIVFDRRLRLVDPLRETYTDLPVPETLRDYSLEGGVFFMVGRMGWVGRLVADGSEVGWAVEELGRREDANVVGVSRQGDRLALGGPTGTVWVYAIDDETAALDEPLLVLEGEGLIRDIAFSPDGGLMAVATSAGTCRVYDRDGELVALLAQHQDNVSGVVFSDDGSLYTSGWDRQALRFDVATMTAPRQELVHRIQQVWRMDADTAAAVVTGAGGGL